MTIEKHKERNMMFLCIVAHIPSQACKLAPARPTHGEPRQDTKAGRIKTILINGAYKLVLVHQMIGGSGK